ncbi:MAG TPA: DUF4105 domain-containing protein [Gemmatimonadaceae bacterium]|nr:DUF4105 domain-containing protein [Gemmatimonadaceae bacterium]
MIRTLYRAALALLVASSLRAQIPTKIPSPPTQAPTMTPPDPLHEAGQNVTISLLTMGNGTEVWELFGHSAIWIHDNVTGRDSVFNWGVFDRTQPLFIPHFLEGLMLYQMGGETLDEVLYEYRYFNRTVTSQQLDLTAAEKDSLLHIIQVNAEPQNVTYRYDYFVDNCATRPRDILDRVLGGAIRAKSQTPSGVSYRWETLRLMQGNFPLELGVDIGLGEPSDTPITVWQTMFLPKALHDFVAKLSVPDSTGAMHPLVRRETVLYPAQGRPPEPTQPPPLGLWLTAIGVVVAIVFLVLGVAAARGSRGGQIAAAIVFGIWAFAAGILGTLLTLLWSVTDHRFAHRNENLLLFNPLWLVLAVLLVIYMWSGRAGRVTRIFAYGLAALAVLALLAHVGIARQVNLPVIGLGLPPALAIAWAVSKRGNAF